MPRASWVEMFVAAIPPFFVGLAIGMLLSFDLPLTDPNFFQGWAILCTGFAAIAAAIIGARTLARHTRELIDAERERIDWQRDQEAVDLAVILRSELSVSRLSLQIALDKLKPERSEFDTGEFRGRSVGALEDDIPILPLLRANTAMVGRFGARIGPDLLHLLEGFQDIGRSVRLLGTLEDNFVGQENLQSLRDMLAEFISVCDLLSGRLGVFIDDPATARALPPGAMLELSETE